jgi:hypothetical protein
LCIAGGFSYSVSKSQPLIASTPIVAGVAVGVAIYGALDYFFDVGNKVDAAVGRKSGIW